MIGGVVARHSITRRRAPLADDGRGNESPDWTAAVDAVVPGRWAIDAGDTSEDETNRDGASVEYTLRGPFAADVKSSDRIVLWGDEFGIFGDVLRQPGPSRLTSHCILRLVRWSG